MLTIEIAALGALPKKIIQLMKLGLFFAKIIVEGLKHGLFCFDLPRDFRFLILDRVFYLIFFVIVRVRIHGSSIACLHDEHDGGKSRSFQHAPKEFVGFHIVYFLMLNNTPKTTPKKAANNT